MLAAQFYHELLVSNVLGSSAYSKEHFTAIVDARFSRANRVHLKYWELEKKENYSPVSEIILVAPEHYKIPLVVHFEPERYRRHSVGGGIKASFGGVMGGTWLCQCNSQRSNERILFSHGMRTRIWSDSPRQNPKRNDKVKTNTRKDSPPADYQGHQISYPRNAINQT